MKIINKDSLPTPWHTPESMLLTEKMRMKTHELERILHDYYRQVTYEVSRHFFFYWGEIVQLERIFFEVTTRETFSLTQPQAAILKFILASDDEALSIIDKLTGQQ